ncbi:glycosyltransferase family 4 protein [Microbacterium sp. USHLN186]|uniref:glycosyltransferase family 4 protein n=1 Tax=Microbacterium sp. USHLN186 TaxID=3081286 RepID=UPI00301AD3C3
MTRAVFAVPGDLHTVTGGYVYERRLLEGLRAVGIDVAHLGLGDSFPDPTAPHLAEATAALAAVGERVPLILDGFLVGAMPTHALAQVSAPMIGIVHHPLAHEEGLDADRRAHLFRTERDNLRLLRAVLVPSAHTARILVAEYDVPAERITVARPGTQRPAAGAPVAAAEEGTPSEPPLVLAVGIQHPRKGHDVLLRALACLIDLPWRAVIVGTPHDRDHVAALHTLRAELGLTPRVRLAGAVSSAERDELYQRADVFALATRYEGYGLVFDEALAHGLPIVSCCTGAVPDTVPRDAGVLAPPDDPAAFAAALRPLLVDRELRGRLAAAAARAGARLPTWHDTAVTAAGVIDAVR